MGKHVFGLLALHQAFMDIEQQFLDQRLGLLTRLDLSPANGSVLLPPADCPYHSSAHSCAKPCLNLCKLVALGRQPAAQ